MSQTTEYVSPKLLAWFEHDPELKARYYASSPAHHMLMNEIADATEDNLPIIRGSFDFVLNLKSGQEVT